MAIAAAAGLALNLFEKPVAEKLTRFVKDKHFGLLNNFNLPKFLEISLAVILLDYTLYIWQSLLLLSILFHHSNVRLPKKA